MKPRSPNDYPNKIIEIFKENKIYELGVKDCAKKGDEKEISRKILKIEGSISSLNYISVPNPKFEKPFAYIGKNFYIFFKAFNDSKFYFQLFFQLNNYNKIRFIFKYPLKKIKITRTDAFNVEIPIEINEDKDSTWILYKFSPIDYINKHLLKYKAFSSIKGITEDKCIFKSFEVCSTIHIRGIFITNKNIEINKLPKEISLSSAGEKPDLDMYYVDLVENKEIKSKSNSIKQSSNVSQHDIIADDNNNISKNEINPRKSITSNKSVTSNRNYFKNEEENSKINNSIIKNLTNISKTQRNLKVNYSSSKKKEICPKIPLYPDPILSLNYIIGYTSKNCPYLKYNSFGDYDTNSEISKETRINQTKKFFYYCSGSNIIKYDPYTKSQKIFMGHSKSISNYIIGCRGEIIFSGEEGPNPIIKIWKVEDCSCIKMLTTPLDKLKSLSESVSSKFLCVAGREQIRELIIIFKIENLNDIITFSKKNANYGINCIKFVPYCDEILISCGYENIKFYRIKNGILYEKSVVMDKFAKNNNFLCIDFNKSIFGDNYIDKGKAFIGSSLGQVIQISCQSQELESIYLVDNTPILTICINEIFAVTGSEGGLCRVWEVDFKEFILEAKHDSAVCSVDISYDSMEILIGGLNGSIGVLNVNQKDYKTLLRSPNGDIKILFVHPTGNFIFTVENKGNKDNLKIWDLLTKDEIYEINSDGDLISSVSADMQLHFFVGFNSGIIKIFDFEKNKLLYQSKPFKSAVENIIFVQNFKIFISMSNLGNLSIHDCSQNFSQIKVINLEKQCLYPDISLSIDNYFFAVNGEDSKYISVRNSETFDLKNNVNLNLNKTKDKSEINVAKKLCLINKNLLGAALCDNSIRFYSLSKYEGIFIKEIKDVHIKGINKFICSKNYNYFLTSGEEGLIKVWDMKMFFNNYKSYHQYIGHSNPVNGLVLIDNKGLVLSSSKNSGIYFWNFLGNITNYNDEIIKVLEKLDDPLYINSLKYKLEKGLNKLDMNNHDENEEKKELLIEDMKTLHMQKKYYAENKDNKYIYNIIEHSKQSENNIEKIIDNELAQGFKILPKFPIQDREEKVIINLDDNDYINNKELNRFENSEINIKDKLLFSVKYLPKNEESKNDSKPNSLLLDYKFCIGLSLNSNNNLIYNKENNWFAFTVNNKIIIEYLKGERKQKIINSSKDIISCISVSNDLKYMLAGIGQKNKEDYASIFIYETDNFSLKKKLNLHPKGIQCINLTNDNKYLISLGTKEENSLCVWDFNQFSVIDMKTVKYNYFSLVIEDSNLDFGNSRLKFITCSFDVISFWELNEENKLENIDITLEEILINNETKTNNEFITGINIYRDKKEYNTYKNYIILSTNKGNILVLDYRLKKLIKKFLICNFPLTKILFSESYFIISGEGHLLYIWKIPEEDLDIVNLLEIREPNILDFKSSIHSLSISPLSNDFILSNGNSDIYYVNLNENQKIKISSSHGNFDIDKIYLDNNDNNMYTLGKGEYIRCWDTDSFDQKYMLIKPNQKPDNIIYNYKNNILITQYENSYLTAFNTKDLKSYGKIYIPNEDIKQFCLIFDNNNILLITFQINIYIISIKNYKPLSMLYCFIDIPKKSKYFPYEQNCISITSSNIGTEQSYTAFTFSDGTICIYYMERNKGKIIYNLADTFNLILLHSKAYNDENSQELYYNLINFRSEYKAESIFSKQYKDVILCYHELLKAILVRNFINKTNLKIINLNYFPYCMSINDNGKFIAIGTKEGYIAFVDIEEKQYYNKDNYEPILCSPHYDKVLCLRFSHDSTKLISSSKNEIIISNINK